jgi:hypothetical protein
VHDARYAKTPYCCDFAFVSEDIAPRIRRGRGRRGDAGFRPPAGAARARRHLGPEEAWPATSP